MRSSRLVKAPGVRHERATGRRGSGPSERRRGLREHWQPTAPVKGISTPDGGGPLRRSSIRSGPSLEKSRIGRAVERSAGKPNRISRGSRRGIASVPLSLAVARVVEERAELGVGELRRRVGQLLDELVDVEGARRHGREAGHRLERGTLLAQPGIASLALDELADLAAE